MKEQTGFCTPTSNFWLSFLAIKIYIFQDHFIDFGHEDEAFVIRNTAKLLIIKKNKVLLFCKGLQKMLHFWRKVITDGFYLVKCMISFANQVQFEFWGKLWSFPDVQWSDDDDEMLEIILPT